MSAAKGTVIARIYAIELTTEQARHVNDLDVQIIWNTSHEGLETLSSQLDKIDGVHDTNYDLMFVHQDITLRLDDENDTDEVWEQINKTIEVFLATPLAIEDDEDE